MILAELILGARSWLASALVLLALGLLVVLWNYARTASSSRLRVLCAALKIAALALLVVCLLDPLYVGSRPRPGSNLFLIVADTSRSLQLVDPGETKSRSVALQTELDEKSPWLVRLGQDFDLRKYTFGESLQPAKDFHKLAFTGEASSLGATLSTLADRYRGQPVAGILLLSDGNATDLAKHPLVGQELPPIYPVMVGSAAPGADVSLAQVMVSQTNFDAAPVTIVAEIQSQALTGQEVLTRVLDEAGQEVQRQTATIAKPGERLSQRFLIKPEKPGVSFYRVQVSLTGEEKLEPGKGRSREATLDNNIRLATVDRGGGPYRVLYIAGKPNWEFKFLRRAISKDDEVQLMGLVRIAKKEPKFKFLTRNDESTNPLFRGFGNKNDERAEQYDEPVLLRFGAEDKDELRGGFPKDAEDLYRYHAVIVDDVEAAFFTQDQQSLLQQFVSQRGGGLLMLGGKNSFGEGGYARTPLAEMLPVYLDRSTTPVTESSFRLQLTREGWLQPWVRTQANEQDEQKRLAEMPGFLALNRVEAIKPGAAVLTEVATSATTSQPALVVQPFGRGRVGALLIGDLWRWDLRRPEHDQSELEKSWRQTVRWLVADVPKSVELETREAADAGVWSRELIVRARDKKFAPLDNAVVKLKIRTPDDREIEITAESSDKQAGEYRALFTPRVPGPYRATATVLGPDGESIGERTTGWAVEPGTEEFRRLTANEELLTQLAKESGGEVLKLGELSQFVAGLPNRKVPIVETWTYPLWHQWMVLAVAMSLLIGEWGLRRWRGLP